MTVFDLPSQQKKLLELKKKTESQGIWSGPDSKRIFQEIKRIEGLTSRIDQTRQEISYYREMSQILDDDDAMWPQMLDKLNSADLLLAELELQTLLDDPLDQKNAFFSVHAGAGGTDACDFAAMLYRMYTRWFEKKGFKYDVTSLLRDEEAGYRSITVLVSGDYVFGHLKAEAGVHRLVRISPFNAGGKRQTSFASCEVVPEMDEVQVEMNPADLKIETFRSGGAGGQHVNKTESAVRITHVPTSIVVECQNERSQMLNRKVAMKMLASKLYKFKQMQQKKELEDLQGEKADITFGSQIRSYVLHPYRMVKDHRTGVESGNVDAVLDGAIDDFVAAYLRHAKKK